MKTFLIKSNYEYEIEAKDETEAIEKWHETITDDLAQQNKTLATELTEDLYAEEIYTPLEEAEAIVRMIKDDEKGNKSVILETLDNLRLMVQENNADEQGQKSK